MKKLKDKFLHYIKKDSEIEITLFKVLGIAGILVSIFAGLQSILMGLSISGGLINFVAAILSFLLLWFVDKTGKYVVGYIITTVAVFMGLFTMLFFEMGGLYGSMPYFFTFSLVFSFLMFRGKLLIVMETIETLYYVGVCCVAYVYPQLVTDYVSEEDMLLDQVTGFVLAGIAIGLIFLVYIAQYRKQKEIAEEASNAKSRFLANMSHEIRTPINMMMGMNEMIYREADSDTIREYAQNAEAAGKQLLFEVNQVLQFSRLNAVKEELINEPYDFSEMLGNISAYFGKEAANKSLEFLMEKNGYIPKVLKGDMRKLLQIITNLLSNSIKYTKEGCITFTVRNESTSEDKVRLYFEVKDTGVGIEKSALKTIFSSFERADLAKNRNIEGTGLGLAIAQGLAELFGSRIYVESEYGKGSKFYFTIEQEIGDEVETSGNEFNNGSFLAPDAKVLVVDDNKMNLSVVKSLLKKTLIHVITADDARESYEKFVSEKPDLVLMDYMMPEIDGIQAMEHLREIDGDKHTPILVLTADVSADKKEMFLQKGFDGCLYKPIDWHLLEQEISEHLPARLVTRIDVKASEEYTQEQIDMYSELLKPYDISLSEGLKYLGGDLKQYARIAGYFAENYEKELANLETRLDAKNLADLTILFHSLKGNARNVGAIDLYHTAKRLEKRARQEDISYITSAAGFVKFEWLRAKEGVDTFLTEFNKNSNITESYEQPVKEAYLASADLYETAKELLESLESYNRVESLRLIDELIENSKDGEILNRLKTIREDISEIEFEKAQKDIKGLMEQNGTGNNSIH